MPTVTPTPMPMSDVLTNITDIVEKVPDWVESTVGVITDNPIILFGVLVGFIGIGIGLIRRFFKLHA